MLDIIQQNNLLTRWATCGSVLPERDCPICGSLQFKGFPQRVQVKCRRCKTMLMFEGERVSSYNIQAF